MHKTLQIPLLLKAKQKNTVNYSIFCRLIAKNAGIYNVSAISSKHGRHETLQIAVFWQLLDAETLVFRQFFACDGATPLNRFFVLMNAKNAGTYTFFKKSKIVM